MLKLQCDSCNKEYDEDQMATPLSFNYNDVILENADGILMEVFRCRNCWNEVLDSILGN